MKTVAIDPESQPFWHWVAALIGFGGWGYKSMTHGQMLEQHDKEIKSLKETREKDLTKLDAVILSVGKIDTKLDLIHQGIEQNRHLYVERRKQHIRDTGGEPEE